MKCPDCGGEHCQFMSSHKTDYKAFGSFDACCGFILMGPIGLLCGFCGSESKTTVNEYWICHDCGKKFSNEEGVKNLETKKNTIRKFFFYLENAYGVLDSERRQWETIQAGINQTLEGKGLSSTLVIRNPAYVDNGLERMKQSFGGTISEQELTYCIITDGIGVALTNRGVIVKDHVIPYIQICTIYLFSTCVFVNQTCIRMTSENGARTLYNFLTFAIKNGNVKEKVLFYHYDKLLSALQKTKTEPHAVATHYSTQKEYDDCLQNVLDSYFRKMKEISPNRFIEYQKIKDHKKKIHNIIMIVWLILAILGVIFLSLSAGIVGFLIGIVIIGIIPAIALGHYLGSKSFNQYKEIYLTPEICDLMEEQERSALEKKGIINVSIYKDIIANMESSELNNKKRFCTICGKKLELNWTSCPYCGSDLQM